MLNTNIQVCLVTSSVLENNAATVEQYNVISGLDPHD